jgi:ATP-binding cassette subfamily B protein
LKALDLAAVRSRIAVVMQDYARFPATLRENIGWGYLPKLMADQALSTMLTEEGIDQFPATLAQGLETPLGRQLEDGIDLSGGQWQRVAIARALMRLGEAELLVFDEPTAALDPKNEHEIYRIFRSIARGRMAVVVSHRLALAKLCDRIIVLLSQIWEVRAGEVRANTVAHHVSRARCCTETQRPPRDRLAPLP